MFVVVLAGAALLSAADTVGRVPAGPRDTPAGVAAAPADTIHRKRAKAIELSDAYVTRLAIHRIASYATIPLFAAQYVAGTALFNADATGEPRPEWARSIHRPIAYSLGALFLVNSVTGGLNWWETRHQAQGRTWRTAHAVLMLASDAGFAYAGSMGTDAKFGINRNQHRAWAIGSMAVALTSYVMMLDPIRGDK